MAELPGFPQRHRDAARVRAATSIAETVAAPPTAPEHVALRWRGLAAFIPSSVVTAVVMALIAHFTAAPALPADDAMRAQVRDIAADVRDVKASVRDQRTQLAEERAFTARDIPLLAAVAEHGCSAKFAWHDGLRPIEPEWLAAPLNGAAPQWQPALAMLAAPRD